MEILEPSDYTVKIESYEDYKLADLVLLFFGGRYWHVVKLIDMLNYPILHFSFEKETGSSINSVVCCPITLRCMVFDSELRSDGIIDTSLQLHDVVTGLDFSLDATHDKIGSIYRREVKLIALREVFSIVTDIYFIVLNKLTDLTKGEYLNNRLDKMGKLISTTFHPKTIVHIVEYFSKKHNRYKHTVLIGHDIDRISVTGYNYNRSGLLRYMKIYRELFEKKEAFIFPMVWYMVDKIYPNIKTVWL